MAAPTPSASPLFLREPEIRRGIELLYFGYSHMTRSIDEGLAQMGLGRAHHRALYFIARQPDLTVSQLLQHLAQSIEYSMTGYPEMKSAVFRALIGNSAWTLFNARGEMTHSLTEPIPGAPALDPDKVLKTEVNRLLDALAAFEAWQGPLKPHFAYGELDKFQYTRAHLMHLANHWTQLRFPPVHKP